MDSGTEKLGLYIDKEATDMHTEAEGEGAQAPIRSMLVSCLFPSSVISLRPNCSLVLGSANHYTLFFF